MRLRSISITALLLIGTAAFAQQAQQAQPGPHPKSQKEVDALRKVQTDQQASNWKQEIQDINSVLEDFSDTEFKPQLLNMAMDASQRLGDYAQTVAWGERVIQNDPNDITARVTVAETMAQHMRDTDLDKDQTAAKVNTYANKALELLKTANTPPQGIPDAQWGDYKKQLEGQAHDSLGLAAAAQKNYPQAIDHYKAALAVFPNPIIMTHLATSYLNNKQYDDAIATDDKILAMGDASASVKQVAQQQKDTATKLKGSK
ncbi:MAG: tetratricopeptide repeat protein [Acidobacteriaceae bacterium]|nr:tetratricopeptide repeat protein [Acidobacteriaceae bacterium]